MKKNINLLDLIPKDKFDEETVELLKDYTFEEIEPIMPQLLEWLQDGNWPVSRPLGRYLKSLPQDKLEPYIMDVLNGPDYQWKYFLICILGGEPDKISILFLNELKRLAYKPTEIEKRCELDEVAQWALE